MKKSEKETNPEMVKFWKSTIKHGFGTVKGVYDWDSAVYGVVSNLAGACCQISMLLIILNYKADFISYLNNVSRNANWVDFSGLVASLGVIPALSQLHSLQNGGKSNNIKYNPDNFLFNRWHAVFNSLHLWVTVTMVGLFVVTLLVYLFQNCGKYEMTLMYIFPVILVIVFAGIQAVSDNAWEQGAVDVDGISWGVFAVALIIVAVAGFSASTYKCKVVYWSVCLAADLGGAGVAYHVSKKRVNTEKREKASPQPQKVNTIYIPITIAVIIIMIAIMSFSEVIALKSADKNTANESNSKCTCSSENN